MKNIYKNKSFYNRILDKFERRNRGNLLLLLNNYFFYFKAKIKKISTDKRAYILEQLNKNSKIVEKIENYGQNIFNNVIIELKKYI